MKTPDEVQGKAGVRRTRRQGEACDMGPDSTGNLETRSYNFKRPRQSAQEVSGPLVLLPLTGRFNDNV